MAVCRVVVVVDSALQLGAMMFKNWRCAVRRREVWKMYGDWVRVLGARMKIGMTPAMKSHFVRLTGFD